MRRGEQWGRPALGSPDLTVHGGDADLAGRIADAGDRLVRFDPLADSDVARAVGLGRSPEAARQELPMDLITVEGRPAAVNMVVVGTPPDRQRWSTRRIPISVSVDGRALDLPPVCGVVVATGEYLRGFHVNPRSHPGDGRIEVLAFALGPFERRAMRARLAQGAHLPHPRIVLGSGRIVEIVGRHPLPVEIDGVSEAPSRRLALGVRARAYRLLV